MELSNPLRNTLSRMGLCISGRILSIRGNVYDDSICPNSAVISDIMSIRILQNYKFFFVKRYMVHRNDGTMYLFIIETTCKDRAVCLSRAVGAYFVMV